MKKRNIIIATASSAILLSGLAFAGAKSCKYHHGGISEHKIEHIVDKLDSRLDLTDQQEAQISEIFNKNADALSHTGRNGGKHGNSPRFKIMELDPQSADYQTQANELATQISEKAKQRVLKLAGLYQQVSNVLTEDQRTKANEFIQKRLDKKRRYDYDVDES